MFRSVRFCLAPLATLKPVLAASVASQNSVTRFIGFRSNRTPNVKAINSVIEKTKGEGLAGMAAVVTRAGLYTAAHNPQATITEIDKILPNIQDEPLRRMAIGTRLHARNELLDIKETALNVSGGATEAEVSEIRSQLKNDYKALKESSAGCWLVQLADAEYSMYVGDAEAAYQQFVDVEGKIRVFLEAPIEVPDTIATPENTNPYSLLGFKLKRAYNTKGVKLAVGNKTVEEGATSIADDPRTAAELGEVKKILGVQLSDEEAMEVVFTLQAANVRHHFHQYFPQAAFEYADWSSEGAEAAKRALQNSYMPTSSQLGADVVAKVRSSVPSKAFFASEDKLREVIKSAPKDVSIIASIRAAFGPGPQTALSNSDEALEEALSAMRATGASTDSAGSTAYARQQRETAKILARQILYRTQVQMGVALTELNQLHKAVEVITPVITANEYIYMWRALLARSRAYKGLGLITNSDKDAKTLKGMKKSLADQHPHELV